MTLFGLLQFLSCREVYHTIRVCCVGGVFMIRMPQKNILAEIGVIVASCVSWVPPLNGCEYI